MNKNFVMLSGLPRSGSTVLSSMLNQHPGIYASTTSPLADLVIHTMDQWTLLSQQLKNNSPEQIENIIEGIIRGAYKHIEKSTIIDKNRLWPRLTNVVYSSLQERPKIICTVRKIPEILSSYILLFDSRPYQPNFVDEELKSKNIIINTKNRCKLLWEVYINHPYRSLLSGYNPNQSDMLFLDYNDIVNHGQKSIDKICDFINIDKFNININDLQPMLENDEYHGFIGLHNVRKKLQKTSPPAEDVIGKDLVKYYSDMKLDFWNK